MAFERVKTINGKKYKYLVESYYDREKKTSRQRVVRYLGAVDDKGQIKKDPSFMVDNVERVLPVGKMGLYYMMARKIGLRDILEKHCPGHGFQLLTLVLNQACNRLSLQKAAYWAKTTLLPEWEQYQGEDLSRDDLERGLHCLCHVENGVKVDNGLAIQKEVASKCQELDRRKRKKLFYDITKITYYGSKCSYAEKGYNREHRGKMTIGLGMVISMETGFPIRCGIFPGSRNDTLTIDDMLTALKTWGYKKLPIIFDRGMVSADNIAKAREKDFQIITCCPENRNEITDAITLWDENEISNWKNSVSRPSGETVYVKGWKGKLYNVSGQITVVLNPKRKALEKANRDIMLNEITSISDKKRIKELRRRLSRILIPHKGRKGFKPDEDKLTEEERRDGRFLLFCTDRRFSGKSIFNIYFQRDEIEKSFRCLKGEISLGPIRYQKPERIDAYITIVFLAYLLRMRIRFELRKMEMDLSVSQLFDEMKSVNLVELVCKSKVVRKVTRLNGTQKKIVKQFGMWELFNSA